MKLLGREEEDMITAGIFYVAVVQELPLFGSETWVMTPRMEKDIESFHHRVVRRMVGMGPKHQQYGT